MSHNYARSGEAWDRLKARAVTPVHQPEKPSLFQVLPVFRGTNAGYYRQEEIEKYTKRQAGAHFAILRPSEVNAFEAAGDCELILRADDSFTEPQLRRFVTIYRGSLA